MARVRGLGDRCGWEGLRFGGDWARVGKEKANSQTVFPIPSSPGTTGVWGSLGEKKWRVKGLLHCTPRETGTTLFLCVAQKSARFDGVGGIRMMFPSGPQWMMYFSFFTLDLGHISVMVMTVPTLQEVQQPPGNLPVDFLPGNALFPLYRCEAPVRLGKCPPNLRAVCNSLGLCQRVHFSGLSCLFSLISYCLV